MTDHTADRSPVSGAVLLATAIATIALLLNHPGGQATDFAGVLKEEAANLFMDGVVHGGFIVVLAIQLACYAIFCGRIGWRPLAIAGLAFFAIGAAMQMASLTLDGLVIPRIAARYLAAPPDKLPYAKSLFVLCGIAIQLLMPMGLFFQGAGVASWGATLVKTARGTGLFGALIGIAVAVMAAGALVTGMSELLMIAIGLLAAWAAIAGITAIRET